MSGYLELFIGPMFAGKTTKLEKLYNFFTMNNQRVKAINYIDDIRYNNDDYIWTHSKNKFPCVKCKNLNDIYPILTSKINETDFNSIDIFLINEGQFYSDIVEWVKVAVSPPYNKHIYVCGLDGDYKREVFGNWLDILPYCDKITKLTANCHNCKSIFGYNAAIFTHRTTDEKEVVVIGTGNYIPLCRKCYNELTTISKA